MKIEEIQKLLQAIDSLSLMRVEIETDGLRLIADKSEGGGGLSTRPAPSMESREQATVKSEKAAQLIVEENEEIKGEVISSPIIGTFYAAPSPDADPYVAAGDRVNKDQTVCIVEAMKLMNEVTAEESYEILECLVEDGQPVEYGQALFRVRKVS